VVLLFLGSASFEDTNRLNGLMPDVNSPLANRLRELRGDIPLNQVQRATGIQRALLSRYEIGQQVIGDPNLQKLADFYKTPYVELKELQFYDLYPQGSQARIAVLNWAKKMLSEQ
jgi:transcriptional regulator with XRE-family HTH domain